MKSAVFERVLKTISRYNMLAPGVRVIAAVSGGADSVALLHVLIELVPRLGATLTGVVHLNHKRRGDASDEDERFVASLAARHRLPFHCAQAGALEGNLEQAMRNARREFFTRLIREGAADCVAVAHTRDDQAETVLFRVLRGSGLSGLAGIHPVTDDGLIRPLLDVPRAEIEEFLRARGIEWREDATNRDPRFARNRIRHELLPQLARDWNPKIVDALAQLGDLAWEEERMWGRIESCAPVFNWRSPVLFDGDQAGYKPAAGCKPAPQLPVATLAAMPRAQARRLIRWAIAQAKGDLRRIEFEHIESVLDLATRATGDGRVRLPGVDVRRSFGWLRIAAPSTRPVADPVAVRIPGDCLAPDRATRIHFELAEQAAAPSCDTLKAELWWKKIPDPVEVRGWRPGDCYRPVGEARDHKLKDMFQQLRIPSWKRAGWPIVTSGGKILWTRDFGPAAELAAGVAGGDGPVLRIWEAGAGPF